MLELIFNHHTLNDINTINNLNNCNFIIIDLKNRYFEIPKIIILIDLLLKKKIEVRMLSESFCTYRDLIYAETGRIHAFLF